MSNELVAVLNGPVAGASCGLSPVTVTCGPVAFGLRAAPPVGCGLLPRPEIVTVRFPEARPTKLALSNGSSNTVKFRGIVIEDGTLFVVTGGGSAKQLT